MLLRLWIASALLLTNAAFATELTYAPIVCGHHTHLILDTPSLEVAQTETLPTHFRSTDDLKNAQITNPSGLASLHLSGGAQFSAASLRAIQKKVPGLQYDIDLRQEPHAFINDGIPLSLFGTPHDWSNTCQKEHLLAQTHLMDFLNSHKNQIISIAQGARDSKNGLQSTPLVLTLQNAETEEDLTQKAGIKYFHVGVIDHQPPTQKEAMQFVEIIKKIPPGASIYLHCHAGEGRTSTFMVMYDIIRNAKNVSFEDIVQRQKALGGIDLLNYSRLDTYKQGPAKKRAEFLRTFYNHCKNS